ncbi:MAG: aminoacyl-tRNA hydrolase [Candidatus Magasanikbacteria bacterium]|nr:aminoacyl-tRNA hydrolase [Candidatus Magasanikbacteria bacterium]
MKLIVGLGNPGKKYKKTRHNVGFMVLDSLFEKMAELHSLNKWELSKKFNAEIAGFTENHEKIILAKPMTFMNLSGQSVQLLAHYYKIPPRDIIVVHDDKDLFLGDTRIQQNRGHAGHNGIKSIINSIGTENFQRVRVGIAVKNERKMQNTPKFVLGRFNILEKNKLSKTIEDVVAKVENLF